MNIVEVIFQDYDGKTYDFYNPFSDVGIDDIVVVDTVRGMALAKVVEVKNFSKYANKYVIQRVDVESHYQRLENRHSMEDET